MLPLHPSSQPRPPTWFVGKNVSNSLTQVRKLRIVRHMEFVEFPVFIRLIDELLTEEQRREMQNSMLENPETGAMIVGGAGIRKMRWKYGRRGKSGGIRIIYYFHKPKSTVYFLLAYPKSEKSDLSQAQIKQLAKFAKEFL